MVVTGAALRLPGSGASFGWYLVTEPGGIQWYRSQTQGEVAAMDKAELRAQQHGLSVGKLAPVKEGRVSLFGGPGLHVAPSHEAPAAANVRVDRVEPIDSGGGSSEELFAYLDTDLVRLGEPAFALRHPKQTGKKSAGKNRGSPERSFHESPAISPVATPSDVGEDREELAPLDLSAPADSTCTTAHPSHRRQAKGASKPIAAANGILPPAGIARVLRAVLGLVLAVATCTGLLFVLLVVAHNPHPSTAEALGMLTQANTPPSSGPMPEDSCSTGALLDLGEDSCSAPPSTADAPPAPPPYTATVTASTSPPTPIQPRRKPARATLRIPKGRRTAAGERQRTSATSVWKPGRWKAWTQAAPRASARPLPPAGAADTEECELAGWLMPDCDECSPGFG